MRDHLYIKKLSEIISENIDDPIEDDDLSYFSADSQYGDEGLELVYEIEAQFPDKNRSKYVHIVMLTDASSTFDEYNFEARFQAQYGGNYKIFTNRSTMVPDDLAKAIITLALDYDLANYLGFRWTADQYNDVYRNDPNEFVRLLLGERPTGNSEYPVEEFTTDYAQEIIGFLGSATGLRIQYDLWSRYQKELPNIINKLKHDSNFYDQINIKPSQAKNILVAMAKQL